jgi:hypothetical protein
LFLWFYERFAAWFKTTVMGVAPEFNPRSIRLDALKDPDHDPANQKEETI